MHNSADPGQYGPAARAPTLHIGAGGGPGDYRRYGDCGPVVIAKLRLDRRDRVIDAAFALFDPAWLAEQPGFLFADGQVAGGGGKKKIEF